METRKERDTMGTVRVPKEALYGAQTQRAVENFPISGLRPYPAFIWSMATIKRAAAQVHRELGLLDADVADAIDRAAGEVMEGEFHEQFVVDPFQAGAGTSHHMNTNEVIANRANELLGEPLGSYAKVHPNDHVNMAQSTNDTIHVAVHIAALEAIREELLPALKELSEALRGKSEEFDDVVKFGRTHLQDAVPMRLGQEFGGFSSMIDHALSRLGRASEALEELAIGGTAVGTGLNAHPRYPDLAVGEINRLTGLELPPSREHVRGDAEHRCVRGGQRRTEDLGGEPHESGQ